MTNNLIEVQLAKPERLYERCYLDFMDTSLLTGDEKIIFLTLKRFLDVRINAGTVEPTIDRLVAMTSYTRKKVIKTIKSLVQKKVIIVKQRGLTKPNLYILNDTEQMWKCNSLEELAEIVQTQDSMTIEQHIEALKKQGCNVIISEKKEVASKTDQSIEATSNNNINNNSIKQDYKLDESNCQEVQSVVERYSLEQIKEYFCYEAMIHDNSCLISDIDSVMNILHDTLNTTKATIRISGEDKPTMSVIGKLMKLTHLEIMYAIEQYNKQTEKIKFSTNYMLKLLYVAKEQMHLDTANRVQYDMTHQNQTEEVKEQQPEQNYEENQPVNQMEQAIEVCKNYSKEQEAEYKERYKKTILQGINQESFDKQGAISDLEKEWSKPNQGGSLPSEQQGTQQKEITKSIENYTDDGQRQYSQEFMDDLEVKLCAMAVQQSD